MVCQLEARRPSFELSSRSMVRFIVVVPFWTEYPIDPGDAPAHQPLHVATAGVLSTVVVATPSPHCKSSCSPESESCAKSEVRTFNTPDTTSALPSLTRR